MVSAGAVPTKYFLKKSSNKKLVSSFLVIEAALVCISRLYLWVHYPSDVIGDILLESGISLLVSSNYKIFERIVKMFRF